MKIATQSCMIERKMTLSRSKPRLLCISGSEDSLLMPAAMGIEGLRCHHHGKNIFPAFGSSSFVSASIIWGSCKCVVWMVLIMIKRG